MQAQIDKSLLGGVQTSQLLGGTSRQAGGLNLLPAGDAIQPGEAIAAQNWRTDQAGILRSRKGHTLVRTLGPHIHTIQTVQAAAGNRRYYGAGTDLYREGTVIGSGFDGNALGVVSFQNRLWVMNPNHQVKDDGTNYWPWTPVASVAAPTASLPAGTGLPTYTQGGLGSGALTYGYSYYVVGYNPVTGATTQPAGPVTFESLLPPSNTDSLIFSPPTFADAGVTQWNLYRISNQDVVNYGLDPNTAYLVNAAPVAIAGTYTDTNLGVNAYAVVVPRNITITVTDSSKFGGAYTYYVTGVTDRGEETNPSLPLAITVGAGGVTVTRPAFVDVQITKWNLYRSGGNNSLPSYLVNPTPILLATTTFLDSGSDQTPTGGGDLSDAGLVELGTLMRTDRTAAPAAKGLAGPYCGKLLAFNSIAHPNRVWWTPSNEPSVFRGADSEIDGDWVDVGEEGEEIEAIAVFPRWVAILKGQTIYRMVGDPDDWGSDIERTNAEVGLMGKKAFAIAGSTVFIQGEEGAYAFTGDAAVKVSPQLDPIFKGDGVELPNAIPSAAVSPSQRQYSCMAYRNGRLHFSYTDGENALPNLTAVYEGGRWVTDTRGWTALYYEGQGLSLLGAVGGSVYALGESDTDAGAAIPLVYQSRYADQGAPENDKRYADILIEHDTGGRTFRVHAYLENGTVDISLGTINSTSRTQQTFLLGDSEYKNIAIRLESEDAGSGPAQFYAIAVHYILLERNARTYDSEKVPLGKVSLLETLEVDLEILSGTVSYAFYAGLDGTPQIASGTLSGILKTFTIPLPQSEARWVRLIMYGDNYRCHGARLQIQPFGCYLAGVNDTYRSGDLTLGSPRVKLLSQVRVDCDPDGTVPGIFLSDMPGSLANRQALSLVATVGRTWQRQNLPRDTRGRVLRIEFTAPSVCRLYAIQVRAKVMGEGSAAWQWLDVPVDPTPPGFSWVPLPLK